MVAKALPLILFLILIPALAYLCGRSVISTHDSEWSALLAHEFGDKAKEIEEHFHFADFCADPTQRDQLAIPCSVNESARFMRGSSVVAAEGGIVLFALIGVGGYLARFNRKLLLLLFAPALYVTVLAAIALVFLHASLAAGTLYMVYGFFFHNIFLVFLACGVAFVGILGCIAIVRATISVFFPITTKVFGRKLAANEQPELYATVRDLAAKIGVAPPDHIVVGFDANFFVTDAKLECYDRRLWGRTMYLSLPLCRILSREEFFGVIGHELGHFKGLDTTFGRRFYPIYRLATECVSSLGSRAFGGSAIALYPAYYGLSFFLESFSRAERKLRREQELAADQVGASLVGPTNCGTALVKTHAFQEFDELFRLGLRDSLDMGQPFTNASRTFAEGVRTRWDQSSFDGLEERDTPHPTSTHPTLKVRLQQLNLTVNALLAAGAIVLPDIAAINLIENYGRIEEELTDAKSRSMVIKGEVVSGKICPACHRKNPFKAESCECGFNFLRLPVG
jgi:Zn-dependent protease with chaperone function/ribosomal protein L40E